MASARVHSLDTLKDVKAALAEFIDSVNQTMAGVDADINRISQWLTQDRPAYWKAQVRRREDEVAKAQQAISRKILIAAPEPASIVEERKMLDKARRRLADAQRKLHNVQRWGPIWEREALLYKTACRGLAEAVHRDMPMAAARLDLMMESLDSYLKLMAPEGDGDLPPAALGPAGDGVEEAPSDGPGGGT